MLAMSMTHQRKREKEKAAAKRRIARMEVTLKANSVYLGLFEVPDRLVGDKSKYSTDNIKQNGIKYQCFS